MKKWMVSLLILAVKKNFFFFLWTNVNLCLDLGRMYKLFGRVKKGHDEMKSAISEYIRELGKAINETVASNVSSEGSNAASGDKQTGASVAIKWVQEVLDLKDKFDKVQNLALSNDKAFQTSFNEVGSLKDIWYIICFVHFQGSYIYFNFFLIRHLNISSIKIPNHPSLYHCLLMIILKKD